MTMQAFIDATWGLPCVALLGAIVWHDDRMTRNAMHGIAALWAVVVMVMAILGAA